MEAVKLSWNVQSIQMDKFVKAFYCQKSLLEVAKEVRRDIRDSINGIIGRKFKRFKLDQQMFDDMDFAKSISTEELAPLFDLPGFM